MKHLQILLYILITLQTTAQIQNGKVREINSDKQPLSNVQIIFEDAIPTTSDDNGNFRLKFSGKKAGDLIFWETIEKVGYEIVNKKALEILKISSDKELGVDIILAKKGIIALAKKEFYQVSDKALLAGLEREKKALKEELDQAKITENEYSTQLTALQEQYDWQWELLDELANKFARVNFDDVSEEYEKALLLFKQGKIEVSLQVIQPTNLLSRLGTRLEEQKRIESGETTIAEQIEANEAGIRQDIEALQLHAELYTLNYQIDEAEAVYDQLLRLDSTDLEILQKIGAFYRDYHRYSKAVEVYNLIVRQGGKDYKEIGKAYGSLGDIYRNTGKTTEAISNYEMAHKEYEKLHSIHPKSTVYQMNLATSYERLGGIAITKNQITKAQSLFNKEVLLFEDLCKKEPHNILYIRGLGLAYQFLGRVQAADNKLSNAIKSFIKSNQILYELYNKDKSNTTKSALAISYQLLGFYYAQKKDYIKTKTNFEQYHRLNKELYESNPQNLEFKNGLATSYMKLAEAEIYLNKNYEIVKKYLREAEKHLLSLNQASPQNVEFKESLDLVQESLALVEEILNDLKKLGF